MGRIVYIVILILIIMIMVAKPGDAWQLPCQHGLATMHGAWYQVFRHFPERFDPNVAGFIAVNDCNRIGDLAIVRIDSGRWWLTRVADCRNPAHTSIDNWIVDVDLRLWAVDGLPVMPLPATICLISH